VPFYVRSATLALPGAGRVRWRRSARGGYVGGLASVDCAPFARALTGISLSGEGADWWRQAEGRYTRTQTPAVGSLLVLRRSGRLPSGHVAVVSQVLSRRRILVTQANWVHHRVTTDQPVIDVSENADWSTVRVWWPPAGGMGAANYPAFGFIRPDHPLAHDRLIAPAAVRIAEGGW
jgi:CHAP domain